MVWVVVGSLLILAAGVPFAYCIGQGIYGLAYPYEVDAASYSIVFGFGFAIVLAVPLAGGIIILTTGVRRVRARHRLKMGAGFDQ